MTAKNFVSQLQKKSCDNDEYKTPSMSQSHSQSQSQSQSQSPPRPRLTFHSKFEKSENLKIVKRKKILNDKMLIQNF